MGAKYSYDRGKHWEVSLWLVFDAWGGARMTRGEPDISANERAMRLSINVPHSLFKVPQLSAKIDIAGRDAPPVELDLAAIETALSDAVGAKVEITIKEPENA
jgi:hypothetical protein